MKKPSDPDSLGNQLYTILLCVIALFVGLCYIMPGKMGIVGTKMFEWSFGLFGGAAILIPFLVFNHALFHKRDVASGANRYKWSFSVLTLFFLSVLIHSILSGVGITINDLYTAGQKLSGGGLVGGWCALTAAKGIGTAGVIIFSFVFLAIFAMFLFGLTPAMFWDKVKFYIIRWLERREANKGKPKEKKVKTKKAKAGAKTPPARETHVTARRGEIDPDVFYGSGDLFDDTSENDIIDLFPKTESARTTEIRPEIIRPVETKPVYEPEDDDYGLESIFNEPVDLKAAEKFSAIADDDDFEEKPTEAQAEIKVERKQLVSKKTATPAAPVLTPPPPPPKEPPKPKYLFPPIDLLQYEKSKNDSGAETELRTNAEKLVETLGSFNIHTRVVNISRGPAVTRYEIAPEAGTKVSAIVNRVDDISLGLASAGVLVEGVIPGKSAIGIEVPNRNVSLVYLRELIDTDGFREAKSKINAALGIDLTGTKIYIDIAKMPHLLIAGATGMGKSVCMNSIIVSLLYKATPDEVKFIFIDPKKVELNIYNGLPHLLVPVVFDPKKAAGALHWCVVEMERRYDILEAMGKRNLAQYNEATADDPTAERLPQIVIVIDELADLMTTAPDDVETSISRIAAKARAAGMHLIIGTQRPDVSVITGTIKANIPSRIAFTVASQIDSRTILDGSGAEKLVGRGDMLYSPVGSRMPLRVQGAYVDEKEIEKIVHFIKDNSAVHEYDSEVIERIEKEAELCGKKGKAAAAAAADADGGDEDAADDPMLKSAIEIAIDEKKISTSLIQRCLSLGYGRAAKLIDVMERRGIVSPLEGQKPRSVLITREQYYEMQMRDNDNGNEE